MNSLDVIKEIEDAFSEVERPETSLRQFKLTDEKGMAEEITDKEWYLAGRNRVDNNWWDIPDSEIKECDCLMPHMVAGEFQYYLPAYMRYTLKHLMAPISETLIPCSTIFALSISKKDTHYQRYNLLIYSVLDSRQKTAITHFLEFIASNGNEYDRVDANAALRNYWSNQA